MNIETYNLLRNLEEQIDKSLPLTIFHGYTAINKRGVEKIIDELYKNLPTDIKNAREYLRSKNINFNEKKTRDIYDNIQNLENNLEKGFHIAKYIIINIRELEKLLDRIYESLPEELYTANQIKRLDNM